MTHGPVNIRSENKKLVPRKFDPMLTRCSFEITAFNYQITWRHISATAILPWRRSCRLRLKCDGTRAETRFRLSAKRTSPFKSAGGRQFSRLLAAEVCAAAVVMLDTPCSEIVWRVLATQSIRQFPLHFPSRASPCAITFQQDSTYSYCKQLLNIPFMVYLTSLPICQIMKSDFVFHVFYAMHCNINTQ